MAMLAFMTDAAVQQALAVSMGSSATKCRHGPEAGTGAAHTHMCMCKAEQLSDNELRQI